MRAIPQRGSAYGFSKPASGGGGAFPVGTPFELIADGAWTWCDTIINSVERSGALYTQVVDSAGTNFIHKHDLSTASASSFQLSTTGLEVDDHNAGSLLFDSSNRIISFYGMHNDPVFRSKRSTAPLSIAGFTGESQRGTGSGPYAYPHIFRFSQVPLRTYFLCRRWIDGSGTTRRLALRTSDTLDSLSDANWPGTNTWSAVTDLWSVTGFIPYWQYVNDGVNKIHIVAIDKHPVQGQNSLYHWYGQLDGSNNLQWFKSDGTSIGASLPFGPSDVTLIYDGSAERCWAYDLAIGADGHPRVLYCVYPGNTSHGAPIEYWYARWTGSAWVSTFITMDGPGLYIPEIYYAGGLCFDARDPDTIYLSAPISGVRQIQEWSTSDNGASWSKVQDITSGGTAGTPLKFRPYSPRNYTPGVGPRVIWLDGRYTTFTDYDLRVMALV
jgi:hypothetical protein